MNFFNESPFPMLWIRDVVSHPNIACIASIFSETSKPRTFFVLKISHNFGLDLLVLFSSKFGNLNATQNEIADSAQKLISILYGERNEVN